MRWTPTPYDESMQDNGDPAQKHHPKRLPSIMRRQRSVIVVQSYRERLQQDPVGTLNSLGVAPVASGGAQGYRVDSLASSPYLAQTGLQPGDVVLSVNGRPVGDVQQDQAQIDNIVAQGSARLEVQRGTRRFFVTASLK